MSLSMTECWFCNKSLLDDKHVEKGLQKYAFWCNKTCHDKYIQKTIDDGADTKAWSDFMAGEAECPDHLKHLLPVVDEVPSYKDVHTATKSQKKGKKGKKGVKSAKKKTSTSGRVCGACGEPGHNARTCGKPTKKPTKKHSSIKKASNKFAAKSERKQYQCRVCEGFGHNARTCPKNS